MRRFLTLLLIPLIIFSITKWTSAAEAPARAVYRRVTTEEKIVALTFDDGPHPKYTPAILDLLKQYDAKATFFVIGKNMELYGDAVRRAAEEGHEIGNHTYAHPPLATLSSTTLEWEILENEALIEEYTGKLPTVFRPPEGYCSKEVEEIVARNGSTVILWNIDTHDWSGCPSEQIVQNVVSNTVPGSIVLFHDYVAHKSTTLDALEEILPRLCAAGYRFVTVSELLQYS